MSSNNGREPLLTSGEDVERPTNAVAIFDAGLVDYAPLRDALAECGAPSFVTSHRIEMLDAAALIIPDGPSFADYRRVFAQKRLAQIIELRIAGGRPVLACGSGMHMLCDGVDNNGEFLASPAPQWEGTVVQMPAGIGTATLHVPIPTPFLAGIDTMNCEVRPDFALRTNPAEGMDDGPLTPPRIAWAGPPAPYIAAIDNGALCACAWAPEEAGNLGRRLLRNWLQHAKITADLSTGGVQ